MTRTFTALALVGIGGCLLSPRQHDGPDVDWDAYKPEIEALIGGAFSGTVTDEAPAGQEGYQPCAVAGQAWALSFAVDDPRSCGDLEGHEQDSGSDCAEALVASYPIGGTLMLDGADAGEVTGSVRAQSYDWGVDLKVELSPPPGDFPRQTFEVDWQELEGASTPASLLWGRRITEDDAEQPIWEVCVLPVETRGR